MKKITVIGLGYVGCSISVLLSKYHEVIAVDIDKKKVNLINKLKSPIKDKEISQYLEEESLNLCATTILKNAVVNTNYIIIATPTDWDDSLESFNTESVESVLMNLADIQIKIPIVIKSTVPIGFTDKMKKNYPNLKILFSPEFLREGSALFDNKNPSRIIVGGDKKIAQEFIDIMIEASSMLSVPASIVKTSEAEAIKLFSNAYLALRVSFFNEIDSFSMQKDLSSESIINGVSMDPRIGNFYNNPSFGYGGYCLPKDTKELLTSFKDIPQKLIKATIDSNIERKRLISDIILKKKLSKVGIYRLAMKTNSDNFRSSAIIEIIKNISKDNSNIIIYEPLITEKKFMNHTVQNNLEEFKKSSDLIIANRVDRDLDDVKNKIFTRDIFQID